MQALSIKKTMAAALIAACAGLMGTTAYAAGSYVSNANGANILAKDTWYTTNFPVVGAAPGSSARLSTVSWSYNIGTIRPGLTFVARLCQGTTLACIDVSNAKSGSTTAFSNRSAATPFFLEYRVNGSTSFIPLYGQSAQVIVNWND